MGVLDLIPYQCALLGGDIGTATREAINAFQAQCNQHLIKIVSECQRARYPGFAVPYVEAEIPFTEYPIAALSIVDCFRPSLDSHRFVAAGM